MKKFFSKIGTFFSKIFGGLKKFGKFVEENVDDAIAIAGKILSIVGGPTTTMIVELINDRLKGKPKEYQEKIIKALERAIDDLEISEECLSKATFEEKVQCFVAALAARKEKDRNKTIFALASSVVQYTSPKPIKESMADTIVQNRLFDKKMNISGEVA